MSARPWIFGVGGAVVATAATIVAFTVLADDTGTTSGPDPVGQPTETAGSATITDEGTPSEEPSDSASPVETAAVPVYYVGDTPMGPRLYREFHEGDANHALQVAVEHAVGGDPMDPEYSTPWPSGVVVETAFDGVGDDGQITINLRADGTSLDARPDGMSKQTAEMAVQQLVYTATAVTQTNAPVQLLLNGDHTNELLGVPVSEPLARADHLTTLSLVMVTTPEEGAVVEGSFRAEGIANSFEAHVPWQLLDGERVIMEGGAMAAGAYDKMYPWQTEEIDVSGLEPGTYTFVARTSDPSGGAEGPGPFEDTKTITVR